MEEGKVLLGEIEEFILIAIARLDEEAYGVKIRRTIEEIGEKVISIGAVYLALERLEKKKLVSSWQGNPTAERGGRAKRYFRLEPAGRLALAETQRVRNRMLEGVNLELKPA